MGKVCGKTELALSFTIENTEMIQSLLLIALHTSEYSLPVLAAGHYDCRDTLLSLGGIEPMTPQ